MQSQMRRFYVDGTRIKPARSITTQRCVEKLRSGVDDVGQTEINLGYHGWRISLRLCSRLRVGVWEATGGAVLTARLPGPKYSPHQRAQYTTSLRPGWGDDEVYRAVCRAHGWCSHFWWLQRRREAVWTLAGTKEVPYEELLLIEAERGKDSSYDTMTLEDCGFWSRWLTALPDKGKGRTVTGEETQ